MIFMIKTQVNPNGKRKLKTPCFDTIPVSKRGVFHFGKNFKTPAGILKKLYRRRCERTVKLQERAAGKG